MDSIGIICEYNPFHNGHLYHLSKIKQMHPDKTIVLVLSGPFLERGESSVLNKWDKTEIALKAGIDLIVELPFVFASQSADTFAKGAVQILHNLNVDEIIFGSESGNINSLESLAKTGIDNKEYDILVKEYLDKGVNYPTALSKALKTITQVEISSPNDILGISYIREILKHKSNMKYNTIKRTNNYHSLELESVIASASSIRNALKNNIDVKKYVPAFVYPYLSKKLFWIEDYFPYLKYKIMSEINNLAIYQTVDEGIENRIRKYIYKANTLDELIMNIKTKRYTYNKILRMLTHILCSFTKKEANKYNSIEYIRILGFNKAGRKYLNKIKKNINIPLITGYSNIKSGILDIEFRVNTVYASVLNEKEKVALIEREYKEKPLNY